MAFILNRDASAASLLEYNPCSSGLFQSTLEDSLLNLVAIQMDLPTAAVPQP